MIRRDSPISVMLLCLLLCLGAGRAVASSFVVTGGSLGTPLLIEQSSGDQSERIEVYLVYGSSNIAISYTSTTSSDAHSWYRYQTKRLSSEAWTGAVSQSGNTSTIRGVEPGYGYFVEEGASSYYVWIIDYSQYLPSVTSLYANTAKSGCDNLYLAGEGSINPMYYYWPNTGTQREVQRQYDVSYQTMEYDAENARFNAVTLTDVIEGDLFGASLPAPLCDTDILVSGDYYARHFGKELSLAIEDYQAVAVEAHIVASIEADEESENMYASGSDAYSAPAVAQLSAVANTPTAAMFSWTIYPEGEEDSPIVRFTGEDLDYTFNNAGTFVVSLSVYDQTATCFAEEEMEVTIAESYLKVPNAFSPGATIGVNDEFRVTYKSLVKFKASIFNRWGQHIYTWTDPAAGWDGKKGGKLVQPGVYFYVIEAEGSDGIKYKKSGDINILRPKS